MRCIHSIFYRKSGSENNYRGLTEKDFEKDKIMLILYSEKIRHMKYYLLPPFIILLLLTSILKAQTDVTIRKKEFKNDKTGFEEAWRNISEGNVYSKEKGVWYESAYEAYLKALSYNSINPELNYKTGVAALYSDNREKAAGYFLKSYTMKNDVTDDILLMTGRALQYAGKYDDAIDKLNSYLNSTVKKSVENVNDAKQYLDECGSALSLINDTLQIEINNMGSNINSNADDYAGIFSADGKTMFFASRRQLFKSKTYYSDTKYDENILFSTFTNGKWEQAVSAGKDLTTKFCETPLYLSPSGEELYIYAGYENGGDIKVSNKKNGKWKTPEPVPFKINAGSPESSMTISPSGNEVWFVSAKGKKDKGEKDIYYIRKIDKRRWSGPENAGENINSSKDEESLSFSAGGDTLWFSSNGHNTMGGYDIFYSVKDQAGQWSKAVNCGYPVNTPWDELFYYPAGGDGSSFYMSSNRADGMGGLDIYYVRKIPPVPVTDSLPAAVAIPQAEVKTDTVVIRDTVIIVQEILQAPPPAEPAPVIIPEPAAEPDLFLAGKVSDSESGGQVMARIDVIDLATDLIVATSASSDVDGTYRIKLPARKSYMADFRASGFLSDMKRIEIPETFKGEIYNLDVSLVKVKIGKKVVLNNILFETGKSILTKSSYDELERLVNILEDNPMMKIEISGHTDKTGSEPLNFKLSGDRARAVVEFLVQKGIEPARLESRGFGSLQPIADNTTPQGRATNRRVEFKILEF